MIPSVLLISSNFFISHILKSVFMLPQCLALGFVGVTERETG